MNLNNGKYKEDMSVQELTDNERQLVKDILQDAKGIFLFYPNDKETQYCIKEYFEHRFKRLTLANHELLYLGLWSVEVMKSMDNHYAITINLFNKDGEPINTEGLYV